MVKISIPVQLRKLINGQDSIYMDISTIPDFINKLKDQYPAVCGRLINEKTNTFNRYVNVYINEIDIRFLDNVNNIQIKDNDEILIIPASAGG